MPADDSDKRDSPNSWHDKQVLPEEVAELAQRLAEMVELPADADASPERTLRAAVELLAVAAPGASAASAALWRPSVEGEPDVRVASLPDTARLDDVELAAGAGPSLTALAQLSADRRTDVVDAPDVLTDGRWPAYAAEAVAVGVRAVRALARDTEAGRLTVTLHAVRPDALTGADTAVAVLVAAQTAVALGNAERYAGARRDAHQLGEAMRGRAVIEQAKGVLLSRTGDADEAFAELRRRSQAENVRLGEIAARVVAEAAAAAGRTARGGNGAAAANGTAANGTASNGAHGAAAVNGTAPHPVPRPPRRR